METKTRIERSAVVSVVISEIIDAMTGHRDHDRQYPVTAYVDELDAVHLYEELEEAFKKISEPYREDGDVLVNHLIAYVYASDGNFIFESRYQDEDGDAPVVTRSIVWDDEKKSWTIESDRMR